MGVGKAKRNRLTRRHGDTETRGGETCSFGTKRRIGETGINTSVISGRAEQ